MVNKTMFAANYVMYLHDTFLEDSVESVLPYVDKVLIARTTRPWSGPRRDLAKTEEALQRLRARYGDRVEIFTDEFKDEQTQRNFLLTLTRSKGYRGAFIVDCDEVFLTHAFPRIYNVVERENPAALRIPYLTFIKDASFCVGPPYEDGVFYVRLDPGVHFTYARTVNVAEYRMEYENPEIFHLSYIRESEEEIRAKMGSFTHAHDTDWDAWFDRVYARFHPRLTNFHPVWPDRWKSLQPFTVEKFPKGLRERLSRMKSLIYADLLRDRGSRRLNLGCGPVPRTGYLNIDLYAPGADLRLDITDLSYFEDNSVDEIFMNAVFEHLYSYQQRQALAEWFRVLKPGAPLIIESIPDFEEVARAFLAGAPGHSTPIFDIEQVTRYTHGAYQPDNRIGQMHKDVFTKGKVQALLEEAGFFVERIESVCWKDEANPVHIDVIACKPAAPHAVPAEEAYAAAQYAIEAGLLTEARAALEYVVALNHCHRQAHNDLAAILYQQHETDEAIYHLVEAARLDPGDRVARLNLAEIYLSLSRAAEARLVVQEILAHHPTDAEARQALEACDTRKDSIPQNY